jgi:hypothetical protein
MSNEEGKVDSLMAENKKEKKQLVTFLVPRVFFTKLKPYFSF